jgi:formylglycine-generating enzyme
MSPSKRILLWAAVVFCVNFGTASADVFNMPAGQTSLQFVAVGDPGNAADMRVQTDGTSGYGSVAYAFQIGKYEVTTAQYAQFLNSVAAGDPYGLYSTNTGGLFATYGIARAGNPGGYTYSAAPGHANYPMIYLSWGDAARFCNWLQNGQPVGIEGPGTTETGAYTLNGAVTNADLMAVGRNAGATYAIATENEWYKAAYYKSGGNNAGYWTYPTRSILTPSSTLSATGTNNANFSFSTNPPDYLTNVGAFSSSPGPYGTFDQAGNVWEWTEGSPGTFFRVYRGGSYDQSGGLVTYLQYVYRSHLGAPADVGEDAGFRIVSVPEPRSVALALSAVVLLTFKVLLQPSTRASA